MGLYGYKVGYVLELNCDEHRCYPKCKESATFTGSNLNVAISNARKAGWCVSRDKTRCYCPTHAKWNRNVGCLGRH